MSENVISCPHCAKPVVVPTPELPQGMGDICTRFPQLCQQVAQMDARLKQVADTLGKHPVPTVDFITQMWRGCSDCAPKFEALLKEHPELFQPKEQDDKPFWEKDWEREGV